MRKSGERKVIHLVQMKTKCSLSCYLQMTDIHSPPSLLESGRVYHTAAGVSRVIPQV